MGIPQPSSTFPASVLMVLSGGESYLGLGIERKGGVTGGGRGQGGLVGVIRVIPQEEHRHGGQLPFPAAPPPHQTLDLAQRVSPRASQKRTV